MTAHSASTKDLSLCTLLELCDSELLVVTKGSGVVGTKPESKWSVFDGLGNKGLGPTLADAYDAYHSTLDAMRPDDR
jgi:hypothetical protein